MIRLTEDDRRMLESLRKAVSEALERKRRLGQYAVVWRDGRPQRIEPAAPDVLYGDSLSSRHGASGVRDAGADDSDRRDDSA